MSLSTVLLRVLLCVGLIFNGSGTAVASVRMQLTHVPAAQAMLPDSPATRTAGGSADATKPPCHKGPVAVADTGKHTSVMNSEPVARSQAIDGHSSDCCESGACQCDCAHQMQVVADANRVRDIVLEPTDVDSMMSAHLPPILPHLIRPPIRPVS